MSDHPIERIEDSVVIVSDIHLQSENDERGVLFLQLLASITPGKVRHLVLLGDIFDFCFGASAYFQKKFAKIGETLTRLAHEGTEVIFFQGNHEFFLSHLKWEGVHFVEQKERILELSFHEKLVFSHGDRVYAPWHYRFYLQFVRSSVAKGIAKLVPPHLFDRFCLSLALHSRKKGTYKNVPHGSITGAIAKWADQFPGHHAVVGHFHAPYNIPKIRKDGRILCLESWDRPNCLCYHDGNFSRLYPEPGKGFRRKRNINV
ncbi:MAG: metallophosphoesterase [Deltaproteobacteria bacterium]|nr:metallophosphoesterase [Deltaproteobacteria bacterium]